MRTAAEPGARERILTAAGELFYEHGFHSVGIDLVIRRSGVAKATLYRHFPTKDDLIVAYLIDADAAFVRWFDDSTPHHAATVDVIGGLFDAASELAGASSCLGCAFQIAAAEFPSLRHPVHAAALAHKSAIRTRLQELAVATGAPEPHRLADGLLLLLDGAFAASRMFGPENPSRSLGAAARALVEQALDEQAPTDAPRGNSRRNGRGNSRGSGRRGGT